MLAAGPLEALLRVALLLPRWPVRGGLRAGLQKDEAGAGRHLEVWRPQRPSRCPLPHILVDKLESQGPPRPTSELDSQQCLCRRAKRRRQGGG